MSAMRSCFIGGGGNRLSWACLHGIGVALTQNPVAARRRGFECLGLSARLDAVKTLPRPYAAGAETWAAWVGGRRAGVRTYTTPSPQGDGGVT